MGVAEFETRAERLKVQSLTRVVVCHGTCIRCGGRIYDEYVEVTAPDGAYSVRRHLVCPGERLEMEGNGERH